MTRSSAYIEIEEFNAHRDDLPLIGDAIAKFKERLAVTFNTDTYGDYYRDVAYGTYVALKAIGFKLRMCKESEVIEITDIRSR